ncbi:collagen alpha-1(I) chain-like isoform X1 [Sorex araneus]|uniref:collagen alpha-1(I) chain-like isoform X1 n=1 Tax=Sorex araneus TaxID=42254 RepID=UPI002433A947|nr:collagen alpha-1(I) chain-like isoform X1 [Sorex araneus]
MPKMGRLCPRSPGRARAAAGPLAASCLGLCLPKLLSGSAPSPRRLLAPVWALTSLLLAVLMNLPRSDPGHSGPPGSVGHPNPLHLQACENAAETRPCTPTSDRVCAGDARPGPAPAARPSGSDAVTGLPGRTRPTRGAGDPGPAPTEGSGSGGGAGPLLACVLGSLAVLAVLAIVFLVLIKFPRGRACLSDTGRRLWRLRRCLLDRGNLLAGAVRMLSGPLPAPLLKALPQPSRDAPDPEEAVASLGDRPPADQPGMELLPREPGRVEQE